MKEQQKPPAQGGRLKKWKTAIANWAAYRLLLILHRTYFADAQQPEEFVVLPAEKVESPSPSRHRPQQIDSRLKILFLNPRHNGHSAANQRVAE
ncbi:hypothetical protein ACTHSM_05960 [Neisseria sp. P0009.S001]|uniref:hypothetical protein n=1 Tax=Neisseria sp. P0009.S001 TaxID=3436708 RepID=UPI003F809435